MTGPGDTGPDDTGILETGPRWLDEAESRAWRGYQEMQMRLAAELARRLAARSAMSAQDYAVLVMLTDRPDGRARLHELADGLGWEKSRVSHHINRMVKRGLVTKEPCPDDARGAYVVITIPGRDEIVAAAPGHLEDVRELFVDRLSVEQLDTLGEIAEIVIQGLDRALGDR